jgi:hypothetical protein
MDLLTGLFALALYKATETVWTKVLDKGFDAAWAPVDESLKARFTRWAGKGQKRERRAAFAEAVKAARELTLRQAADRQQAERILELLDGKLDRRVADAFAEEAARLMLFSAVPDVPRLTDLCRRSLGFQAIATGQRPPPPETIAVVLADFLTNLREALLDQDAYRDLVQHDIRRILNEILAEERPVPSTTSAPTARRSPSCTVSWASSASPS